jgi:hypothetical protein
MPSSLRVALSIAISLGLVACGKGSDAAATTATATAAPPLAAPPPTAPQTATSTAAPTPSPTQTAAAAPPAGGACALAGDWSGTYPPGPYPFSGTPLEFIIRGDGTGTTRSARADSEFAWKAEGGTFSIHGTSTTRGGRFTCTKDQVGKWGYSFSPDCNTLTMKLQQDPCKGRAKQVEGGLSVKRK